MPIEWVLGASICVGLDYLTHNPNQPNNWVIGWELGGLIIPSG